jgi:Na+-driven multidrug efflux pump
MISCFIGLFILFTWKLGIKIKLADLKPDFKIIKENFQLGLPSSIEMMSRSLSFAIITWIVTTVWLKNGIQTELLDAYWVGWMIMQVSIFMSIWLSMASTVLVWQQAGAGFHNKAKKTAYTSAILSFAMMTFFWVLIFILAPFIIEIFIPNSPRINELWTQMVRTSGLFLWFLWIQMTFMWAMKAIWKTQIPMFITILWAWFIQIPFAYFFSNHSFFGLDLWIQAIWWANPLQIVIIAIIMFFVIKKVNWKNINLAKNEDLIN